MTQSERANVCNVIFIRNCIIEIKFANCQICRNYIRSYMFVRDFELSKIARDFDIISTKWIENEKFLYCWFRFHLNVERILFDSLTRFRVCQRFYDVIFHSINVVCLFREKKTRKLKQTWSRKRFWNSTTLFWFRKSQFYLTILLFRRYKFAKIMTYAKTII